MPSANAKGVHGASGLLTQEQQSANRTDSRARSHALLYSQLQSQLQ